MARHPATMLLNGDASRLYVASASTDRVSVIDTRTNAVVGEVVDTVPRGAGEGSTPSALLLSPDEKRLFVAEADNNAVAEFDLSSGRPAAAWAASPSAGIRVRSRCAATRSSWSTPRGAAPRRMATNGPGPGAGPNRKSVPTGYTLGQLNGTVSYVPLRDLDLAATSRRVARAERLGQGSGGNPYRSRQLSAIRARDLHHQGEPHLRPGLRRSLASRWRHVAGLLQPGGHAQSSRARRAVRHLRSLLRECGSERGRPQLDHRGVHHRLRAEDRAAQLRRQGADVRLRGHEPRRETGSPARTPPNRPTAISGTWRSGRTSPSGISASSWRTPRRAKAESAA